MPARSSPPDGIPPEAVLLRLAWETVQATRRPRPARLDPGLDGAGPHPLGPAPSRR